MSFNPDDSHYDVQELNKDLINLFFMNNGC